MTASLSPGCSQPKMWREIVATTSSVLCSASSISIQQCHQIIEIPGYVYFDMLHKLSNPHLSPPPGDHSLCGHNTILRLRSNRPWKRAQLIRGNSFLTLGKVFLSWSNSRDFTCMNSFQVSELKLRLKFKSTHLNGPIYLCALCLGVKLDCILVGNKQSSLTPKIFLIY